MDEKERITEDGVSDAPTIIGKRAEDIRNAVNSAETTGSEDEKTQAVESSAEETTDNDDDGVIQEFEDTGDDDTPEDIDDFSDIPQENESIDITGSSSSEPLTASAGNNDPTLDRAVNLLKKPGPEFMSKLKKLKKAGIITASVILALFIILYIICILIKPADTVSKNIWIGDLYVGGLSYDEVLASVEASDLMSGQEIKLKCGDNYYVFNGADVGSAANSEETAKRAFNYGKSGNFLKDGLIQMRLLFGKYTMNPPAALNRDMLAVVLERFGTDIYGELKQHSVEFIDSNAVVTPGHTGFDGDVSTALEEVEQAVARAEFNPINVTLKNAPPYDFTVETFDHMCYKDPVDARYEVKDNTVEIIPEENGRYINKDEVAPFLPLIKEGGEQVTVPVYPAFAEVTAAVLKEQLFSATLGSYSTYYGSSTSNRKANVARAASLINGKVIAPGEVFSFNDTVGPRTTANGFFTAKEYVNGKSVDGIGGGTCQVSTTLYSAVLYADLNIVARENHMMSIGYAPLGQDATVAYNSVDFKFRNSTNAPVKIVTTTNGSNITISIVGTAWSPAREVKISHSTSYSGEKTIVTSVRKVYSNGELISTDKLGTSVYHPHSSE